MDKQISPYYMNFSIIFLILGNLLIGFSCYYQGNTIKYVHESRYKFIANECFLYKIEILC